MKKQQNIYKAFKFVSVVKNLQFIIYDKRMVFICLFAESLCPGLTKKNRLAKISKN